MAADPGVGTKVNGQARSLLELFQDTAACDAAIQASVDEAIERHRLLGQSIVTWENGRVVVTPASQIEPLESVRRRREAGRAR